MRLVISRLVQKSARAALTAMLLVALGTSPLPAASYEELVAQARQGQTVDPAALRNSYADSASYDAYNTDIASLRAPFQRAFADSDCDTVVKLGQAILEKNYVYIDGHYILGTCYSRLGQTELADRHIALARGLIGAIIASGDGKTPETAYTVIAVSEEYTILSVRGLKKMQQALVNKGDHAYDVMTVENKTGAKEQVYFNVDRVMRWSAEKFGGKK
jgi:hypothetical protein